jgi:hypothetical protein
MRHIKRKKLKQKQALMQLQLLLTVSKREYLPLILELNRAYASQQEYLYN